MNQETIAPSKQKKILFIITKATWGGAQRYVFDLARSLPREKYLPIIAYGEGGVLVEKLKQLRIETVHLPLLQRDISFTSDLRAYGEISRCIREHRPDIVHVNSSKAAFLGALASRRQRVKRIVFTVHGWPFKEARSFFVRQTYYLVSWLTALLAHSVIVVSLEDQKRGEAMPRIAPKLNYVPIGIQAIHYVPREEALQALWNIIPQDKVPRDTVKIVTIAELTPNKGISYAIEAMHDLGSRTNTHYVYIIIGQGEQREELEQLARSKFVFEKVFFLGFIPEASKLLMAFDVFLLPSIKEGMPYVLLEAGDTGMPVIATDVVNPDLAQHYPNIRIIRSGNAFAISDAIAYYTESGTSIPVDHTPRFPLSDMVQRTVEIYG